MLTTLTIAKPDDWHIHLRDDAFLKTTVLHAAERFARAIIMPNLKPAITTIAQAKAYRDRIISALPVGSTFMPLMTLYLTDATTIETIIAAKQSQIVYACKLYPAGSTTHSDMGVTDLEKLYPVFEQMQKVDLPLLIHGEVTDTNVDIFDREAKFIDNVLQKLQNTFPSLRMILEHITTKEAVEFIQSSLENLAATITPHHLLMNRNDIFVGGIRPHHYCLPILKRRSHQESLIAAATSGNKKFFLGTDSAPHEQTKKESHCGCAGIYSAHAALELYAEVFENAAALTHLESFCSFNGPDFYKLPRNNSKITLVKESWEVPLFYNYGDGHLIPLRAGSLVHWKLT